MRFRIIQTLMAKALMNFKAKHCVYLFCKKQILKGISYKERMVDALGDRGDEGRTRLR